MPILPLDGGRIMHILLTALLGEKRGGRAARACSITGAYSLLASGAYLVLSGRGAAVVSMALWLVFAPENSIGIEKRRKIM